MSAEIIVLRATLTIAYGLIAENEPPKELNTGMEK